MKTQILSMLVAAMTAVPLSAQTVIAVSPDLSQEDKKQVARELQHLLFKGMKPGDLVAIVDARNPRLVSEFFLDPSRKSLVHPTERKRSAWKTSIANLQQFMASPSTEAKAHIHLPNTIRFVASQYKGRVKTIRSLIVYGNPIHMDDKEPTFNFTNMAVPSDVHILAGRRDSVFGLKELNKPLEKTKVFWVYPRSFAWDASTDLHRHHVERWWWLWFKHLGTGGVHSYSHDLATTLQNMKINGLEAPVKYTLDAKKGEPLSMIELGKRETVRVLMESGKIKPSNPLPKDKPDVPKTISTSGKLKIGIRWEVPDVDLDIYSAPRSGMDELYFKNPRASYGRFWKDHTTAPVRAWELIEFSEPVDLRKVKTSVNFYSGKALRGVRGELIIHFIPEGQNKPRIFTHKFHVKAPKGNGGKESGLRSTHKNWVVFDVAKIVGLRK